jgi:hypothetical protein
MGRRPTGPHGRLTRRIAARAVVGALLVVLLTVGGGEWRSARGADPATHDWMRSLYVVSDLATHPPQTPVVLLLGGSSTRESTISDHSWSDQIVSRGGPRVVTRNLSSRNQTFAQDLHLVGLLPSTPTVVFIGVNVGRFFADPTTRFQAEPGPYERLSQHRYTKQRILTPQRKERVAAEWMRRRYPPFAERFAANRAALEQVVATCLERGLRPVMLDMPRNTAVIGDRLDVPIGEYSRACAELAARYRVPFVSFVSRAGLESGDFFDIAHLVEPGRAKWQRLLSDTTVDLLTEYGMTVAGEPPPETNGEIHDWCVSSRIGVPVFAPQSATLAPLDSAPED